MLLQSITSDSMQVCKVRNDMERGAKLFHCWQLLLRMIAMRHHTIVLHVQSSYSVPHRLKLCFCAMRSYTCTDSCASLSQLIQAGEGILDPLQAVVYLGGVPTELLT